MTMSFHRKASSAVLAPLFLFLAACGGDGGGAAADSPGPSAFATFKICPGPEAQTQTLKALFEVREGDTIEFCAGAFDFDTGLVLHGRRGVTLRGAGKDFTVLRFRNSGSSEGINVSHTDGITIENLTVQDTPGNAIRVFRSRYVTLRGLRVLWSGYQSCSTDPAADNSCARHGAYGLYPVESRHVLIEDSEAFGASDAGIYVGQTSDVIVRRTRAEYNVAGFEFENTYRAVFEDNVATNNAGGFLVFDLPGLRQYGEKNVVRNNKSYNNNLDNFAPVGNIVGVVPRGTGMLMLATDQLEIYGNEIHDNDTTGIAIVNFGLVDPAQPDMKYDFYPEGMYIHDNRFRDNGGNAQLPNPDRGEASLLPLLIKLKNLSKSAHIVWDGAEDATGDCAAIPVDEDGVPLTAPNPNSPRDEPRTDERGRPNFQRTDPEPACKWNAWKFDAEGNLKPENRLYIENNVFENTRAETVLVDDFVNAYLTSGDPVQLAADLLVPASNDLSVHAGSLPPSPPPVLPLPFVPRPDSEDARPSAAEIEKACKAPAGDGPINWAALARYNCPRLDQYGLFRDPAEPRREPKAGGVPFDLNSALFSDYAVKYRILFLPPGTAAVYRDRATGGVTATLELPVGTVIAKTFAFRRELDKDGKPLAQSVENVVETRLLIKRATATGTAWVGLPYIWRDTEAGRVAELRVEGGTAAVEFDYLDPDPAVKNSSGQPARYSGAADKYQIPAAMNCITCHGGDDREPGAAPLGLKPRYLNRDYDYGGNIGRRNQLDYLRSQGLLTVPEGFDYAQVEKHPRWNVPGDTGAAPDSAQDIHQRVRAYLEVNCMHCHTSDGAASNSNLFLDSFRTVNISYGICKKPVAAGKGSGEDRMYDIVPGDAEGSILPFRVLSAETGIRMPPLARTVVHGEAANLIATWIDSVLSDANLTEDEEACTGPLAGTPLAPLPGILPLP